MFLTEQDLGAMAYREMAFSVTAFYQSVNKTDRLIAKSLIREDKCYKSCLNDGVYESNSKKVGAKRPKRRCSLLQTRLAEICISE